MQSKKPYTILAKGLSIAQVARQSHAAAYLQVGTQLIFVVLRKACWSWSYQIQYML